MEESEEVENTCIAEVNFYPDYKEINDNYGNDSDSEEEVILARFLNDEENKRSSNFARQYMRVIFKALPECLEFINKIIHCDLLLEEDLTYLINLTSELIPHKKSFMNSKRWSFGVGILDAISTYLFIKVKKLRAPMVPVITGSTVLLVSMLNRVLTKSAFDKKLHSLLDVLQKTYTVTRKITNIITKDYSFLSSKERMQRSHQDILKEHTFKKKLTEMSVLTDKTAIALKLLIRTAHKANRSLINHEDEHEDELGLEEIFKRPHNLATLHTLKNIYLKLQSDCLLLLGISLSRTSSYDDISTIFKVVNTYMFETSCILEILQIVYTKYIFPFHNKKDYSVSETPPREEQLLIHDISRSLNGLLIEMRELKMLVDSDENEPGLFDTIVSRMTELEDEFSSVLETFKNVKKHFTKYLINYNVDTSTNELFHTSNQSMAWNSMKSTDYFEDTDSN